MEINSLRKSFYQLYGREDSHLVEFYFAPGRICLIGEHIDYNGGWVMPAAISKGIYAAMRKQENAIVWMRSQLDDHDFVSNINDTFAFDKARGWANYPLGVLNELKKRGYDLPGAEVMFHSNLPVAAGLSSSACVEVLTAYMFTVLATKPIDRTEIAVAAQHAENEFIGLQSGIMDQFAIAHGKKNNAILLNCGTLEYAHVPLKLGDYRLVVLNTNKKRTLTEGKYNERVAECQAALKLLQAKTQIQYLVQADPRDIEKYIKDPILKKRAHHVSSEQRRVQEAATALRKADIESFGNLLFESHRSLKNDYEVSGHELDTMVEGAEQHPGCIGAKMSGAGFGGCAFALVKKDMIESFIAYIEQYYQRHTGRKGTAFQVDVVDGVGKLG
ncbi:galactokinase [soil metagenome]